MCWIYLLIAIGLEVWGTALVKASNGFTRLGTSAGAIGLYALSILIFALALRKMDVTVAYVIWSGVGTAIMAAISVYWFGEVFTAAKIGLILVILMATGGLMAMSAGQ